MTRDRIVELDLPDLDPSTSLRLVPWLRRAVAQGLVGGAEPTDHLRHALGMAAAVEHDRGGASTAFLDLGSGGGLPGMVLLERWPGARATLLDASSRRAAFLQAEVDQLGWDARVEVRQGRAEELGHDPDLRERFPVMTARSFGAPAVTAECGAPFLEVGGSLVVAEPPDADPDARWPRDGVMQLGLDRGPLIRCGASVTLQVLWKVRPSASSEPRGVGRPAKRPRF